MRGKDSRRGRQRCGSGKRRGRGEVAGGGDRQGRPLLALEVGAGERHDHAGGSDRPEGEVLPGAQVDVAALGGEPGEHVGEVLQATSAQRGIGGVRGVVSVPEDATDHAGQRGLRADLHERSDAGRVHALDELDEADRGGQLIGQQCAGGGRLRGVRGGGSASVDIDETGAERRRLQRGREAVPSVRDELAVERRRHVEAAGAEACVGARRFGRVDGIPAPREHALLGGVPVGEDHVQGAVGEHRLDVGQRGQDGEHRAAIRAVSSHQSAPLA